VCAGCGAHDAAATFKRCARCMQARYCSPECQKHAWKAHKLVCTPKAAAAAGGAQP
jgi:hypothetical protein